MGMTQNLEKIRVSPLGGLQGQVLDRKVARTTALLVNKMNEPLELSRPRKFVHLQHTLYSS